MFKTVFVVAVVVVLCLEWISVLLE